MGSLFLYLFVKYPEPKVELLSTILYIRSFNINTAIKVPPKTNPIKGLGHLGTQIKNLNFWGKKKRSKSAKKRPF